MLIINLVECPLFIPLYSILFGVDNARFIALFDHCVAKYKVKNEQQAEALINPLCFLFADNEIFAPKQPAHTN